MTLPQKINRYFHCISCVTCVIAWVRCLYTDWCNGHHSDPHLHLLISDPSTGISGYTSIIYMLYTWRYHKCHNMVDLYQYSIINLPIYQYIIGLLYNCHNINIKSCTIYDYSSNQLKYIHKLISALCNVKCIKNRNKNKMIILIC